MRSHSFQFTGLLLAFATPLLTSCPDEDVTGADLVQEVTAGDTSIDIVFDTADSGDADTALDVDSDQTCTTAGGFGCPCVGAGDCLGGQCIEGPDGNICTRACIEECPDGFDCLTTSLGAGDPVTICVPRHTRLCRPCVAQPDCQNPLDPTPAVCVPAPAPEDGSFCATSCAQTPCPSGYACDDVTVGAGIARVCLPLDDTCECRPAWTPLGLTTGCQVINEAGACGGTRTCAADGLTACDAATPATEGCNLLDDDCDGKTDNIAPVTCDNITEYGQCAGVTGCSPEGDLICTGKIPAREICNGSDDNCDSNTDERWDNCVPSGCRESDGVFIETGEPSCVEGQCAYTAPRPCGLYTCGGGGDAGDTCASGCGDDTTCIATAHCDEASGTCVPDVIDGGTCADASDCGSGHCQNGFCCGEGDCCNQPQDCPDAFHAAPLCENTDQCQGTRRDARCVSSMCAISEPIADDSGCGLEVFARDCTPNTPKYCTGQPVQGAPACATTCTGDGECAAGFHCDGTCQPDVVSGGGCDEDSDCATDYCENNFCCGSGTCCSTANDCPAAFRDAPACLDPIKCQGERTDAVCRANFTCDEVTVQDDTRCDANVQASGCGPYSAVFCTGALTQSEPECGFTCDDVTAPCDNGFHCDGICVQNVPDGNACDEDTDCIGGHCQNGLCCASGDCCNLAADCPASYTGAPVCDNTRTCQGTREAPVCTSHVCVKVGGAQDDSACGSGVEADTCGAYPTVRCAGGVDQQAPQCAESCSSNAECDVDSYCNPGTSKCLPKKVPGSGCTDSAQCDTGHCQNGFCCGSGDCCANKSDCSPAIYGTQSVCTDGAGCQGERQEPACESFRCELGATVGDDSACAGTESSNCGYFESVYCSAASSQTAPSCRGACTSDNQCDEGAHCEAPNCVPDASVGETCQLANQCGDLACVDGRCCGSACSGTCRRCDDADALGICSLADAGTDPDSECGAVACTGYYWGFEGKTCHARANVTADVAGCDEDGTCQTAEDVCPSAAKGATTVACHATCQAPTAGTCQGTTPGACTNVTGGSQSCGVGACLVTVDACVDGAPASCTPGPKGVEVCDGVDNDCDGLTDAADPDMVLADCQNQNGVCSGSKRPANLCVAGVWKPCTDTTYAAWSAAYQAGAETTCDGGAGVDNDCDGQADEDFTYTGPDGAQVRGAGKACGVGVCAGGVTQCAAGNTLTCSKDNLIASETCDGKDNDCDGKTDSLDPSLVLVNCDVQFGVCSGAKTTSSLCAAGAWQACGATQYSANNSAYESDETRCDGKDNDCNQLVDDGLSPPPNSNQLGVCEGSKQRCEGSSGFKDYYNSSTIPNYNASESLPDASFLDENCDGIDGNVNSGIFVVPSLLICPPTGPCIQLGGTDSASCGRTKDSGWCATVKYAVETRSSERSQIYVRAGTYQNGAINVPRSVQVFGGYDTDWSRAARGASGHAVRIYGGAYSTEGHAITIRAVGAGISATFADLYLHGVAASGQYQSRGRSSYVVHAVSSTVSLQRVDILQANGAAGASGSNGTSATQSRANTGGGGGGAHEETFTCNTSEGGGAGGATNSCTAGSTSPNAGGGGDGGQMDTCCQCNPFGSNYCCNFDNTSGFGGGNAAVTSGSLGTAGGGGGGCATGGGGQPGRFSDGSGGPGASGARGYVDGNYWYGFNGNGGALGANGGGGGGGGGSGGCDDGIDSWGAGGGGGGAGGCRATVAGGGGYGGGGSFGVFAIDATVQLIDSTFARAIGGSGGTGGIGGAGQPGGFAGAGGAASGDSKKGGDGGAGAQGANSGAGGGGAGGAVFSALRLRGALSTTGTINHGSAGGGGSGGGGGGAYSTPTLGGQGATGDFGTTSVCSAAGGC